MATNVVVVVVVVVLHFLLGVVVIRFYKYKGSVVS